MCRHFTSSTQRYLRAWQVAHSFQLQLHRSNSIGRGVMLPGAKGWYMNQATEARASRTERSSLSAAACSSPRHLGSTRECATSNHLVIGSSPRLNHLASHRRAWAIPRPPPPPRGSTRACPRWVPQHLLLTRRSQQCCVAGRASADTDGDSKSSSSCDPQETALTVYSVGDTCKTQVLCEHSQVNELNC